jgi:NAD(P)-dependent dehydrogenase (short-subunit alcohol dehydrogenase family)
MAPRRPVTVEASRAVLVTGGGKRIGRAIALAFAQRGWDVAIHYGRSRSDAQATARAIEALGRRTALLQADLADERATAALVPQAIEALGRLDCIVNNASRFEEDAADTCSYASLDAHYRTNTAAPVILARELARRVHRGAQACVVNLLDQKLFNPNPDFLSYTLSKSALHAATTLLAQALAPKLRVVGVAPGITLTSGDQSDAGFERAHTRTPLGRSSTPEDVAAAVLFAAESRAITGSTLLVDGGQHLVPTERDVMFLTEPAPARRRSPQKASKK